MRTELATQHTEIERVHDPVLEMIAAAARDSAVDTAKMAALFDLKTRVDAQLAERDFNQAFARLSVNMPRVKKNGLIDMGGKGSMKFATWEDVDTAIRPLLAEQGFSLSFSSEPTPSGVLMVCTLTHVSGHSRSSKMQLPPDNGAGRNGLQAIGSSRSYGKRYLTLDMLNIVTEGADNDGSTAEPISREQADSINDLIAELNPSTEEKDRFLKWIGAKTVAQIQRSNFDKAIKGLEAKRRGK